MPEIHFSVRPCGKDFKEVSRSSRSPSLSEFSSYRRSSPFALRNSDIWSATSTLLRSENMKCELPYRPTSGSTKTLALPPLLFSLHEELRRHLLCSAAI